MQFTPHQLKDKLLRGLDQDNNVVDMLGVRDVISILESYPITREALEATRIGKYINEMRKRTNNKDLAKRAKNLVRQWQNLVTGSPDAVNGGDQITPVGGSRTAPSGLPAHLKHAPGSKPASPVSRPSIPANGKTSHSPKLPGQSRCSTPVTPTSIQSLSPKAFLKSQFAGTHNHVGSKPASPALSSGSSRNSPGLPHVRSEPILSQTNTNSTGNHTATTETLLKTNAANKKRRREPVDSGIVEKSSRLDDLNHNEDDDSVLSGSSRVGETVNGLVRSSSVEKLLDRPSSVHLPGTPISCVSGLPSRRNAGLALKTESTPDRFNLSRTPASSTRTPKVASTAELIAKLRDRGLNTNICPDKIEKEKEEDTGVVPPEAKPRPRRKPGTIAPPAPDTPLSQTKKKKVPTATLR